MLVKTTNLLYFIADIGVTMLFYVCFFGLLAAWVNRKRTKERKYMGYGLYHCVDRED